MKVPKQPLSPHFFERDDNGTVRVRLRFAPEDASLIEEAAGETPLITYMRNALMSRAKIDAEKARAEQRKRLEESG